MPTNDNEPGSAIRMPHPSGAHGQAALILVESLIHGLITKSVITTEDSLEIVRSAVDVQADYAADAVDGLAHEMHQSQALLATIADSLRTDITGPTRFPTKPVLVDLDEVSSKAPSRSTDPNELIKGEDE